MEPLLLRRRLTGMRPRVLVLTSVIGGVVGALVGTGLTLAQAPCSETELCRVDVSRGGGCLPGPCDTRPLLPTEFWAAAGAGLLLGLVIAVAFEIGRLRGARAVVQ